MICNFYYPHLGGNEGQCRLLSEALAQRGFAVTVLTLKHSRRLATRESINGVNVHRIGLPGWLNYETIPSLMRFSKKPTINTAANSGGAFKMGLGQRLKRLIYLTYFEVFSFTCHVAFLLKAVSLLERPNVVHVHQSHWLSISGFVVSTLVRAPLVVKEAGLGAIAGMNQTILGKILAKSVKKTAHFVAISSEIQTNLVGIGIEGSNVRRIPNGARPQPRAWQDQGQMSTLFVGNFWQGALKGLDILLSAWKEVLIDVPEAKLRIVGEGDYPSYRSILTPEQLLTVTYVGPSNEVETEMLNAFCFVLPSRSEGLSNALIEAAMLGMPVVASAVSGVRDTIPNLRLGAVVGVERSGQLAAAIRHFYMNRIDAQSSGSNLRARAQDQFVLESVAEKYGDLYAELSGRKHATT